mmetsp:Transcript_125538/g.313664  ORF Transcript_125538/g.313664 Transcript_125538/m.313664 type:complete len:217 (+) Transcript_125538:1072-1722(+)
MLVDIQRHHLPNDVAGWRHTDLHLRPSSHPIDSFGLGPSGHAHQVLETPRMHAIVPETAHSLLLLMIEDHGEALEGGLVAEQRKATGGEALVPVPTLVGDDRVLIVCGRKGIWAEPKSYGAVTGSVLALPVICGRDREGDLEIAGLECLLAPEQTIAVRHRRHQLDTVPQGHSACAQQPVPERVIVSECPIEGKVAQPPADGLAVLVPLLRASCAA